MHVRIFLIKSFHSLIFFYMAACLIYIPFAAITQKFDLLLVVALASMALEGLALLINHGQCPLKSLAEQYGAETGSVTDIFLPDVIARNIFRVSFPLLLVELVYLAFRYYTA